MCGLGAVILISVLTFSPFDTTVDTAGFGTVQNKLGTSGANLGNVLLQLIGGGAVFMGALIMFSGIRRLFWPQPKKSRLERARRGSIFLGAVFFATATFSAFPIPQSWPMATGLGGWIGDGVYLNLKAALDHFSIPISGLIVAGLTFIAGGFCLARYFGIVGRHVMDIWDAAGLVWATLRVWMDGLVNWLRVKFAKTYEADLADDSSIERLMRNAPDETAVTPQPAAYAPIATAPAPSNLSDDIARNMSAQSARIAVVPGRNAMGVELPNRRRETVWLRNMLASEEFRTSEAGLPMVMGEDIGGAPFVADLSKMP